ncbi:MAG: bifunctional riboflavin kinase/FAD synthetase [Aggregatilineales bacterium]
MPKNHIYDLAHAHVDQPSVVTIGVFDGVHVGHQYLIRRVVEEAHARDMKAVVLTFFPHPDIVIRGLEGRYYLTTPEQRAEQLLKLGVDVVVTQTFDDSIRHVRAEDFVDRLLKHLNMKVLRVGADFAMGYQREGNVPFLTALGVEKAFTVEPIELVQSENNAEVISSSRIREALDAGDMAQVRAYLGRGYALGGEVIHGKKRGRSIGFPTANIDVWSEQIIPRNGVYAGWAYLGEDRSPENRLMAMTNIGISPTFMNSDITVEAYLLDFDRDIYGQNLTITFEKYLRPEAKFDGLDALIAQIGQDVDDGRAYLQTLETAR